MRSLPAIAVILTMTPSLLVAADHSTSSGRCGGSYPAAGIVEFTAGEPETTVYVDDRGAIFGNVWIYAESNGVWTSRGPGVFDADVAHYDLQRGGGPAVLFDSMETCRDESAAGPDLLLY